MLQKNKKVRLVGFVRNTSLYEFSVSQKVYLVFKRLCDILLSSVAVLFLLPFMLIVAVIIKLTSKGPAVFLQNRVGQFGKSIKVYKFRTMLESAPSDVATGNLENPELYITKIGKILRMTSFDEILQLFNVLKGEMSLVGPRPIILSEDEIHALREKNKIYSIKPGITGLAQINGRDLLTPEEKVRYDSLYMQKVSLKMDIYILFKSVIVVFKRADFFEGKIKK